MDKLTDFLTVFFVNNSVKENDTKRVKKDKNDNIRKSEIIPTQTISSNQNISNNIPLKIGKKTETEIETPIKKVSIKKASIKKAYVKKASIKKASIKKSSVKKASIKKASVKKASNQQENDNTFTSSDNDNTFTSSENDNTFTSSENDNTELFTKSNSNSSSENKENTDNLEKNLLSSLSFSSYNKDKKEIDKKEIDKKEIDKKEIDKKEIDKKEIEGIEEIDKEEIDKREIDKEEIDNVLLKKYILKPSEFYKKNILIANDDKKNNFDITNDILYKLSLLKDIDNIYSKDIYIFTANDNRKMFKQMLLDNPYLYFIDFHVKQNIDKNILKENNKEDNKEDNKRIICIIDTDILKNIDDLQDFINPQIHLILLTIETNKIMDYYNKIGNKRLLIHKQNKLKSLQKRFFKYVISNIDKKMPFDDYYNRINDENMDLKYIILKEDELRYN
jgi:hypothetical protein